MAALVMTTVSCGSGSKQNKSESTTEAKSTALSIDDLLKDAESLVNKDVTIEGICTHTCKHGAQRQWYAGYIQIYHH